jgi:hypothetical protein
MTYSDGPPPPRSALTLRLVLATFGLVVSIGAAITFATLGLPTVLIVIAAVLALVAVVDIAVIVRRKLHGEPG